MSSSINLEEAKAAEAKTLAKSPMLKPLFAVLRGTHAKLTALKFSPTGKSIRGHVVSLMLKNNHAITLFVLAEGGIVLLDVHGDETPDSTGAAVVVRGTVRECQVTALKRLVVRQGVAYPDKTVHWMEVCDLSSPGESLAEDVRKSLQVIEGSPFRGGSPFADEVERRPAAPAVAATAVRGAPPTTLEDFYEEEVAEPADGGAGAATAADDEDEVDDPEMALAELTRMLQPAGRTTVHRLWTSFETPEQQEQLVEALFLAFEAGVQSGRQGEKAHFPFTPAKGGKAIGDQLSDHSWVVEDVDVQSYQQWHEKLQRSTIRLQKLKDQAEEMFKERPYREKQVKMPEVQQLYYVGYLALMDTAVQKPLTESEVKRARMTMASLMTWQKSTLQGWTKEAQLTFKAKLEGATDSDEVRKAVAATVDELKVSYNRQLTHKASSGGDGGGDRKGKGRFFNKEAKAYLSKLFEETKKGGKKSE